MGWASGLARTVAPGETGVFPLLVRSSPFASHGSYGFTVSITELDSDSGPYTVETSASYTLPAPPPDTTPPSAPTGLNGSSDGTAVSLTWNPSSDDSGVVLYLIYRETRTPSGSDARRIRATSAINFTDWWVQTGGSYRYVVQAFDLDFNQSPESNAALISVPDTLPPSAPTGLTASISASGAELYWNPASDNVAVSGYEVLRDGAFFASTANASFADASVAPGATYTYSVRAFDAAGNIGPESGPHIVQIPASCGFGPELAFILPALLLLRRGVVTRRR
jgi:hypothetical protein